MNIPVLALCVVFNLVFDHSNHDLVTDESTLVHDLLCLTAQRGFLCDLRPEHVSCCL